MALSKEQAEKTKNELLEQLKNSEVENKEQISESIKAMNTEQLEQFLQKNNLIKYPENQQKTGKCIFCSIVFRDIPSYKVAENEKAIAVLDINPASKAHTLIIPKEHTNSVSEEHEKLAKKVIEKIKTLLKPKNIIEEKTDIQGHVVINLIPVYENEKLGERKSASKQELEELQKLLQKEIKPAEVEKTQADKKSKEFAEKQPKEKTKKETQKPKDKTKEQDPEEESEINDKNTWLPKRIP